MPCGLLDEKPGTLVALGEEDVWRYLGGICRAHGIKALQIGDVEDHVHLLLGLPPTLALSDVLKRLKGESSKWLSAEVNGMKGFAWQDGYRAFGAGKSQIKDTIHYIQTQREHHRVVTFQDEYRKITTTHDPGPKRCRVATPEPGSRQPFRQSHATRQVPSSLRDDSLGQRTLHTDTVG